MGCGFVVKFQFNCLFNLNVLGNDYLVFLCLYVLVDEAINIYVYVYIWACLYCLFDWNSYGSSCCSFLSSYIFLFPLFLGKFTFEGHFLPNSS